MTSAHLETRGFGDWQPFNRRSEGRLILSLPAVSAVYCIRCARALTLTRGRSDVLYIGSAANRGGLRARVRQYLHPGPTQWTNKRLLARCGDSDDYQIGFVPCDSDAFAKQLEADLLNVFSVEHRQLPPENRQPGRAPLLRTPAPSSKARRMYDAVAQAPMSPRTRRQLLDMATVGNSAGLLQYLERCVTIQRDVGRSVQRAGKVSFEDRMSLVRKIYEEPEGA